MLSTSNLNFFIIVEHKLSVHHFLSTRNFSDFVWSQSVFQKHFKVPSYKVFSCGSDNAGMLTFRLVKVIKSRSREIDWGDFVLCNIFNMDLQLFGIWFLFSHPVLESCLSILTESWDQEKISLCGCNNPFSIYTHINSSNGVSKSWKQGLRILTHIFIEPNLSVERADSQPSIECGCHLVELWVGFVNLGLGSLVLLVDSWIQSKDSLFIHSNKCALGRWLTIFNSVG